MLRRGQGITHSARDRGFYAHAILAVCCEMPVRCSITIRRHARLRNIIEAIPETDWTPIPSYLDFGDGADHRRPSTDANCQNLPGQSLLHVPCPPFRRRRHPVRWIRAKVRDYTRDPRHNPRRVIIDRPVPLVRRSAPNRPPELYVRHDYKIGPVLVQPVQRVGYALSAGGLGPFGS